MNAELLPILPRATRGGLNALRFLLAVFGLIAFFVLCVSVVCEPPTMIIAPMGLFDTRRHYLPIALKKALKRADFWL